MSCIIYLCVRVSILPLSKIILFEFGIVPTACVCVCMRVCVRLILLGCVHGCMRACVVLVQVVYST